MLWGSVTVYREAYKYCFCSKCVQRLLNTLYKLMQCTEVRITCCIALFICLDESEVETSHSKEPIEQLKAELAELRVLIVDQAKHEGMEEGKL